jgi:hypothetical protein
MLRAHRAFAIVFMVLGVALLVESILVGGGTFGYFIAAVFIALGIVRLRATR